LACQDSVESGWYVEGREGSPTMNLTLPLTPAEEAKLLAKAREAGATPEQVVRQAIEPILASIPEHVPPVKTAKKSLLGIWSQSGRARALGRRNRPKPCRDVFDLRSRRHRMITAAADTHTAVWYLFDNPRLSAGAREAMEGAFLAGDQSGVSSVSLAEMVYLAEKNRIPSTAVQTLIDRLFDTECPLRELPVDAAVAQQMASINRYEVPDMPDRIVAATGVRYGVPVISRDRKIRASRIQTIW
jgi:PIN domain nuclease of toxin-antitoxin system